MTERGPGEADLRVAVPTLEPDPLLLAQLSARAAASAARERPPRTAGLWHAGLTAAAVATVLVGVGWLTGLGPAGPSAPHPTPPIGASLTPEDAVTTAPVRSGRTDDTQRSPVGGAPAAPPLPDHPTPDHTTPDHAAPAGGTAGVPDGPGATTGANPADQPGSQSGDHPADQSGDHPGGQSGENSGGGRHDPGPDAHASDHPNDHATGGQPGGGRPTAAPPAENQDERARP